jgi:hypothetical protein
LFCPDVNCQDVHQQICSWPLNFQLFYFLSVTYLGGWDGSIQVVVHDVINH